MLNLTLRPNHPDFLDLPWGSPLEQWRGRCDRLEEVQRGLSRHPVVFVNYAGALYALKELPAGLAEKEYSLLLHMEAARLPCVTPIGYAQNTGAGNGSAEAPASVLITRYLDHSLPYRALFMAGSLVRYRRGLLDAIAGLLVQLHLAGVYWGDCSLSNTLFRRDAGALSAYLVDAETAELYPERVPPVLRLQDLQIMEENIDGDLADLAAASSIAPGVPIQDTGAYIRLTYQRLWEEITREEVIEPHENYRIQERIRALNALGFSIGEVALTETDGGRRLRLRVVVSDRSFHHDQLLELAGVEAEEMQARQMMNEILEVQATLAHENNRSTPLSVAAYHWLENTYRPTLQRLQPLIQRDGPSEAELYCQVLEHKWFLSERARQDVGHQAAAEDYLRSFAA
jgi:hypothetical protein